jgi:Nucleotidyl transferase AbiEii toxin, Type IV TA system
VSERTPERVYLELQRLARAQGRNTQQLFELYIHERFLARLAESRFREQFVLKGGLLLAVMDVRRTTRDADMLARGISSEDAELRTVAGEIAAIPMTDGVSFAASEISLRTIREDAGYPGKRLTMPATIAGAALKLKLDLSFGDPVRARRIAYPTLLDGEGFALLGYPLKSVIAEKVETMMFLADANTRDRDYGDVYVLAGVHRVSAVALREALRKVAEHRGREVRLLGPLLQTLRETRQQPWEAFRARSGLVGLPERFSDVVDAVVDFIDGVRDPDASRWDPAARRWE